jgi:hypothetical protein
MSVLITQSSVPAHHFRSLEQVVDTRRAWGAGRPPKAAVHRLKTLAHRSETCAWSFYIFIKRRQPEPRLDE